MATPGEQKAALQARRIQSRRALNSPPPTSPTGTNTPITNTEAKRKAALNAARLQTLNQEPLNVAPAQRTNQQPLEPEPTQEVRTPQPTTRLNAIRAQQRQKALQRIQLQLQAAGGIPGRDQAASHLQAEVKKQAKAAMRRGAMYITELLATALDLGSAGISFLADFIIHLMMLGWLNLELFYGKWMMKGKSRFVPALSWDPIPMPVDKSGMLLAVAVIAADLFFIFAILLIGGGGVCLVHDVVKITMSDISEAAVIGAGLAQGQSGGLCLGGIMQTIFGL